MQVLPTDPDAHPIVPRPDAPDDPLSLCAYARRRHPHPDHPPSTTAASPTPSTSSIDPTDGVHAAKIIHVIHTVQVLHRDVIIVIQVIATNAPLVHVPADDVPAGYDLIIYIPDDSAGQAHDVPIIRETARLLR